MTDSRPDPAPTGPTRRDRMRPVELLGLAATFGIFTGLVVGLATREWILALIFFGVVFIVGLVVLAMLSLAVVPAGEKLPQQEDDPPSAH